MSGYDVVIPAGGTIDAAYAKTIGTTFRALAPVGPDGQPLLQRTVEVLRASGCARRVIAAAPSAVQQAVSGVDRWLPAGPSGAGNVLAGLAEATPDRPALVCASDLPFLTPDSVADFLGRCRADAQVAVGLVSASEYERVFPDAPPSQFVRLSETGPVTLGGLFLVHPRLASRHAALFDRLFQGRKSQWRLARLLGPRLLWGWATRRLTQRAVMERAEEILGGPAQIVPEVSPLLAYDIDTADDYTYAQIRYAQIRPG